VFLCNSSLHTIICTLVCLSLLSMKSSDDTKGFQLRHGYVLLSSGRLCVTNKLWIVQQRSVLQDRQPDRVACLRHIRELPAWTHCTAKQHQRLWQHQCSHSSFSLYTNTRCCPKRCFSRVTDHVFDSISSSLLGGLRLALFVLSSSFFSPVALDHEDHR
jgi:hypothetical protein